MDKTSLKRNAAVIGVFLLLTLLMTYPLILHMGTSVRDPGDPLLNAWILSWDIEQILHFNAAGFFEANIFYPQTKTLAYSEFLLPQALVALPAKLISGNPILGHNFALMFAFLTTGLGMYALARFLTGKTLASIAAGFIFAFSPFMISHLYQVQVLTAGGIPLAFLFLHKFFASDRLKDIMLFSLFFILQSLANGYYALYLVVFAGLYILIYAFVQKKYRSVHFWLRLALAAVVILICLGPFFYQYYSVQQEMGFSRDIQCPAGLTSYLATTSINNLYGRMTAPFMQTERALFPGVVPFILACIGAVCFLRMKKKPSSRPSVGQRPPGRLIRISLWVITLAAWVYAATLLYLLGWGGFTLRLGPLGSLHAHNPAKTAAMGLVLFAGAFILRRVSGLRLIPSALDWSTPWIYVLFLVSAFLLTLGPNGPYPLLHKYVPGFNGLRVAARFHVFFMFGLAVLAAYGLAGVGRWLSGSKARKAILLGLPALILGEYLSLPVPYASVPVKDQIPEVYQWLNRQPGDFAVVEFPLPAENRIPYIECRRVYYAAYHWKRMVEGYSGFFPPLYLELLRRYASMPVGQIIRDLKDLKVRMIIAHTAEMRHSPVLSELMSLAQREADLREIARFDEDIVYELVYRPGETTVTLEESRLSPLPRASWSAAASVNSARAALAFDGELGTRWDTAGAQKKGQWFELDLGRTATIRGISLKLGSSVSDYPRGIRVDVSPDGIHWATAAQMDTVVIPIRTLIRPGSAAAEMAFGPVEARAVRLVQTGDDPVYYWSIHELNVWVDR
jgi:hypothetical protein